MSAVREKPDYTVPYFNENYTGPYLSNGLLQPSVAFGDAEPKSRLDEFSRLHDTAYAVYSDYGHRAAADAIYRDSVKELESLFPQLAGAIVLYGNQFERSFENLLVNTSTYGPFGFLVGAAKNMYNLNDYLINGDRYRAEVEQLYESDPMKPTIKQLNTMDVSYGGVFDGPMEMELYSRPDVFVRSVPRNEQRASEFPNLDGLANSTAFGRRRARRRRRRRVGGVKIY